MRIAVDAMGGDYAPEEIIKGGIDAAKEYGVGICLVGPNEKMETELAKHSSLNLDIELVHTEEYLIEGEAPAYALRKKRNASILVATKLVKEGKADAAISAGPTGGVVAASLSMLGTLEGISRPVIGGAFLGFAPNTVIMDLGGNVDCQPHQFLDFAIVGTVYAKKLLNIDNPSVALLNVGAEEGKGNEQVKQSYSLLQKCGFNFIGNVEGYDIPRGKANVIICDGFVGNVLAKFTEALGDIICQWLNSRIRDKLPEGEAVEIIDRLRRNTNVADIAGGGPLWAVNGLVWVAHGRSRHLEISKAIGLAKMAVERDLVGSLKGELISARDKMPRARI